MHEDEDVHEIHKQLRLFALCAIALELLEERSSKDTHGEPWVCRLVCFGEHELSSLDCSNQVFLVNEGSEIAEASELLHCGIHKDLDNRIMGAWRGETQPTTPRV